MMTIWPRAVTRDNRGLPRQARQGIRGRRLEKRQTLGTTGTQETQYL